MGSNARSRLRRPRTFLTGSRTLTHGCRPSTRWFWAVVCSADRATCLPVGAVMSTACYHDSSFRTSGNFVKQNAQNRRCSPITVRRSHDRPHFSFAPGMSITHSARGPHVPGHCPTRGLHNANYRPSPPRAWSAAVSESARSGQERSNISWGSRL